jgi:hypothetical protein
MGAYDNPQMIQTRANQAVRNVELLNQAVANNSAMFLKQIEINRIKAEKIQKENKIKEAKLYNTAYKDIDQDVFDIQQISKKNKKIGDFEGKEIFQEDAINENINIIRYNMEEEIKALGGADASLRDINNVRIKYSTQVKNLKTQITNFYAGYEVFNELKENNKLEDVLTNFRPEMISIYNSLSEGEGNVGIFPNKDGNFTVSEYDFSNKKDPKPINPVDLGEYNVEIEKRLKDKKGYFNKVEKDSLQSVQNYIQNGIKNSKGTNYDFGIYTKRDSKVGGKVEKDPKNGKVIMTPASTTYISLDVPKFREFAKTDQGKNFIQNYYLGQDSQGNQNYDPEALWVGLDNNLSTYSQENLDNFLIERFIKSYDPSQSYSVPVSVEGSDRPIQAGSGGRLMSSQP